MSGTVTEDGLGGRYEPSSSERVREQVAAYEASDGAEGGTLEGKPVVILSTVGVRSGAVRKTPLMRIAAGERYVLVASAAGATTHPAWYRNATSEPRVRLRDGGREGDYLAREVTGAEKDRYWAVAERNWPHFPEYRRLAGDREIPILVLDPVPGPDPAGADAAVQLAADARAAANRATVLEAFDTLFNRRDYERARRFWSPNYLQHSAHVPAGRDGLFDLVRALPPGARHEPGLVLAGEYGGADYVMLHGRFAGIGLPADWVVVDVLRVSDGVLVEHWDVIQDEATKAQSRGGLPMFGDTFPG